MHGSAPGLRDYARVGDAELAALEGARPELAPWLRPLGAALAALRAEPWRSLAPVPAARVLVLAVVGAALPGGSKVGIAALDPYELLPAAVGCDEARLSALADGAGLEAAALSAAAQLAVLPLLQGARQALAAQLPAAWSEPYCPLCGTLPTLVEVRGLERTRTLRCARCGSAWSTEVLLCAFCGERDHERLGGLVPEGADGQLRWVETCASCRGYLKAFSTLRGAAPEGVALQDAASVELDLAALEHGFARPGRGGRPARLRLLAPAAVG